MRLFGQRVSIAKRHYEGTSRTRAPQDTVAWLKPIAARIGVTRLANVTGLDVIGLPVWLAIRPNSRGLATAQGKGVSHQAAQASALMEAIESWHAENIILPVRIADYASLRDRERAVAPERLPFAGRAAVREDVPITWVQGWDLLAEEPVWVPFDSVSTNYVVSFNDRLETPFVQSSNGLAGGNHIIEAINHALAEVIERQSITDHALSIRKFDSRIRVSPESVEQDFCRKIIAMLEKKDILYAIFDIKNSTDIPVYACVIVDGHEASSWRSLPPFSGYGCHVEPEIALSRAITEAVQSRLTHITGSRDDIIDSEYQRGNNRDDLAVVRTLMQDKSATRQFTPSQAMTSMFEEDTALLLNAVRKAGHDQAIVVDLTRPDIGVPVVKLLIPGMTVPEMMIGRQSRRREQPVKSHAPLAA